jgi:uncharacterized membrane protein
VTFEPMATLRLVSLLAATISMGLMAGAFALYAHTIMPGLRKTDDRTFISAFQATDRAIMNPWFLAGTFLGSLVFSLGATIAHVGHDAFFPTALALALYVITFVVTMAVNVPLNDALKRAGDPDRIANLTAVRAAFNETRWARFNLLRTALCLISFGLLAWALVIDGRAS